MDQYLTPTRFIDSDHPAVRQFAASVTLGAVSDADRVRALFDEIRDGIRYDPYRVDLRPEAMTASAALERGYAFCVPKAALLAAGARVLGIPSRVGFADVRNHLATPKLLQLMETDLFVFHGYTELFLNGTWVKATPAFNRTLCERFDVAPLEFDGVHDAMLQPCNLRGDRYMEYVHDRGVFADLPLQDIIAGFQEHYPTLMAGGTYIVPGRFEEDAKAAPAR